jgi:predicted RecA/RadA family phage recombinase
MARNYVSDGNVINWTNGTGSAVSSGDVVAMGHCIGVALVAIAVGDIGSVALEGVFTVPKVSAAVFTQGEKLIYDVSAGAFDDSAATPSSGDITGGAVAWIAGANAETTCTVKLTPGNATKTA